MLTNLCTRSNGDDRYGSFEDQPSPIFSIAILFISLFFQICALLTYPADPGTLKKILCSQTNFCGFNSHAFDCFSYCYSISLKVDSTIACEPCNGEGWIVCDFCEGQRTNVKAENNRIYRRCPSCRAVSEFVVYIFISMLNMDV